MPDLFSIFFRVMYITSVTKIKGVQKSVHIYEKSIFLKTIEKFSGGSMLFLGIVYIVQLSIKAGIIISYDLWFFPNSQPNDREIC